MSLIKQASGCAVADAPLNPLRLLRQCVGTLPLRCVLGSSDLALDCAHGREPIFGSRFVD
jgi:hypothetical protein